MGGKPVLAARIICLRYVIVAGLLLWRVAPACLGFVTDLSLVCHSASRPLPGDRKTEENYS
jgi:hypothetical protein